MAAEASPAALARDAYVYGLPLDEMVRLRGAPADPGNWLPAPAGAFRLILRAYQPGAALLDGRYRLPPIERL